MNTIYLVVNGGLGNQLGQAAFGIVLERITGAKIVYKVDTYHAAEPYGRKFLLHEYFPQLRRIPLSNGPSSPVPTFREPLHVPDPVSILEEVLLTVRKNREVIIDGYWLNDEYQESFADLIRSQFELGGIDKELQLERQRLRSSNYVGIHVRRAEYGHHGLAKISYYKDCLAQLRRERGELPAIVFTDEYNFCSYEFRDDPSISISRGDLKNPIMDFYLLSSCKHYILSNSSFASWAAKIGETSDSIVYAPLPMNIFLPFQQPPGHWRAIPNATQRQ
jgi:hypothetical protein